MQQFKSIVGLLILVVGSLVLYKVVPAYWDNFKVNQMIAEQAIYFTNFPKGDEAIVAAVCEKAQNLKVPLAPEDVSVVRGSGDLSIDVAYTVHIDFPGYPFDLSFKDSTTNHNIMK